MQKSVSFHLFCRFIIFFVTGVVLQFGVAQALQNAGAPVQLPSADPVYDSFEGIYLGQIQMDGPEPKPKIDLSVSLILTDDDESGSSLKRISGSFLVDGEGGPFSFNRVTFRLDTGRVEMRYVRPGGPASGGAASFLLAGQMRPGGIIEGNVVSGVRGQIGKFRLRRSLETALIPRVQYAGKWEGDCFCGGQTRYIKIEVRSAATSATNPDDFEFEYTPGKIAGITFSGNVIPLGAVYVDYLRQRMAMRTDASGAQWVVDSTIDFAHNEDLVGTIVNPYKGAYGDFRLRRTSRP